MAPAPEQGISGLAIAGLILAFLMAPVGLVLSVIALFQTGKGRKGGRGLAVAGVIVSVLAMAISAAAVVFALATVGKNVATVADPGCTAGKDVIINSASMASDPASVKTELKKAVDGLTAASAKARHDDVRDAMMALANDYNELLQAINTGNPPPAGLEQKLQSDANRIDELCTLGGATK
ncbi:hypothetical protein HC028_21835 [Planosporangium flavigriseum]|uniref:hypothetical protein n=1 Tax=Planosporangium flavigriseum TaxID=373681 RepID=UPI00143B8A37|nr:hypothetical protein [Planosporangium flavigriseum]NJC67122.1 hypothetical protein [Planosporangium flavigriseum]